MSGSGPAVVQALLSRVSVSRLVEPAPEGEVLDRILEAGLRAPDHGRLMPWHYVLIRGEARTRMADLVEAALRARDAEVPQPFVDKQRGKFLRPPLTIALGARLRPDHKVPPSEQMLAVGAGAMNLLNAIHASGYGAIWVTGANAYDPMVQAGLGFAPPDTLAGFLFVGTPAEPPPAVPRAALADHVTDWPARA